MSRSYLTAFPIDELYPIVKQNSRNVCAGYISEAQAFAALHQAGILTIRGL